MEEHVATAARERLVNKTVEAFPISPRHVTERGNLLFHDRVSIHQWRWPRLTPLVEVLAEHFLLKSR